MTVAADMMHTMFDAMRAGYPLGETNRFLAHLRGVDTQGSGADYHYSDQSKFFKGIERARNFDRENFIVGQGVDRLVDNVLQDGIEPDPDTGDEGLDKSLKERWYAWGENPATCDVRGTLTFDRIAKLSLRSVIVDGDVLLAPVAGDGGPLGDKLQAFEAHRMRTPRSTVRNVMHGVLLEKITARPLEYWVTEENVETGTIVDRVGDMRKFPARHPDTGEALAFHVFNPLRFSQTRGISTFLPITYPLQYHDDLQFRMMVKAAQAASLTVFRERPLDFMPGERTPMGAQVNETQEDGSNRRFEKIAAGAEIPGLPGEKLIPWSPNPEFFQHAYLLLSIIAVNLRMPVAVLLLDPTKTNFSGWRGAVDQMRVGLRNIQRWMLASFYEPIWRRKLREWARTDAALARALEDNLLAAFTCKWKLPRWPYIEPFKDAQADTLRIEKHLTSRRRISAERGEDFDELVAEMAADAELLCTTFKFSARKVNAQFPEEPVSWVDLMNLEALIKPQAASDPAPVDEGGDAAKRRELDQQEKGDA